MDLKSYLLIINSKINLALFKKISQGRTIICADGGANSLYFYRAQIPDVLPQHILGDFDSISQESLLYFQQKGVEIKHDEDQDTTDLQKGLNYIMGLYPASIYIYGQFDGRLDHTISILSTIYQYQKNHPNVKITVFGDQSVYEVLLPGQHKIQIDQDIVQKQGVGIFPMDFSQEIKLTTTGLKWNLDDTIPIKWGGFLSTSNELESYEISIQCANTIGFITWMNSQYHQ